MRIGRLSFLFLSKNNENVRGVEFGAAFRLNVILLACHINEIP